jgi:signal transduction histidine kinase/CheY-like chemotaxis protein
MDDAPSYEELRLQVKQLEKFKSAYLQADIERQKIENKSRAWLDNSPICTQIVNLDLHLQYMSDAGCKRLQIDDVTRLYGKPYPFSFYPESFKVEMTKNLKTAIATEQTVTQDACVADLDGNDAWFQFLIVPVKDQQHRMDYLIVLSLEITDRKRLERARETYGEQLESLVVQSTAELRLSKKMESLGILAEDIAHNFNNILGTILGQGELCLARLPRLSIARRYVESMVKSGNRASDLVGQIMTFSQRDTQGIKPLNSSLLVDDALQKMRAISPANIEVRQNLPKHNLVINADETQIHQVIHNLCSNASHGMEDVGGILYSTLTEEYLASCLGFSEGDCLKLTVEDSGKGIKSQHQDLIFPPFFTTKQVGKGSGLALSVVHGIMNSHQGKIRVASKLDKGTVFSLFFPISKEEIQGLTAKNTSAANINGRILIVEDEPILVDIYQEFLQTLNYSVTTSCNGIEALSKLKQSPNAFDLVITDQFMPQMTGEQLIPKLLAIRADIPIILTTGCFDLMHQDQVKALGISKFLAKPLSLPKLKDCIDECLAAR